ncbi:MAG: cupin domain-containing protein [Clostridia bacterium]|nr:cupin domain-containing protein [Clostridia bacterium]
MDKFVFRSIDDAQPYKVINEHCPDGYFTNVTLFGDEPQQKVIGERTHNPEARDNFHYVHRTTLPVGGEIAEHPHNGNEQFYLVMEGEGVVTLCGNQFPVKPWCIALIRDGGSHGIRNTGSTPLTYVCVETGLSAPADKQGETPNG